MTSVPYNDGVASVSPEAATPNDYLSSSAATPPQPHACGPSQGRSVWDSQPPRQFSLAVNLATFRGNLGVIYDSANSYAQIQLSSVDASEWMSRDARYVPTLPAGQAPGPKIIVTSYVGLD